ncbi:PilZ domain-containing protein [Aquipuribacter sp. SD81]|uniref:PilZ domain-containing protein n=1 Tax=Aquipuribacter sp. SD81 TaxID=3127703 RepID=UPI003019A900
MSRGTAELERPRLNAPVVLGLPGVPDGLRSRLEDLVGADLVVAAVLVPGRVGVQRPGATIAVTWAVPPRGALQVSCTLVEVVAEEPPRWVLRPAGPARRVQRRRFVRADVLAGADLEPPDDAADDLGRAELDPREGSEVRWRATGVVADLSEGGARVVLDADQPFPARAGEPLVLSLRLPDVVVSTGCDVVAVERAAVRQLQVRVRFDLPDHEAGLVRREVLRRQGEARAAGARS